MQCVFREVVKSLFVVGCHLMQFFVAGKNFRETFLGENADALTDCQAGNSTAMGT